MLLVASAISVCLELLIVVGAESHPTLMTTPLPHHWGGAPASFVMRTPFRTGSGRREQNSIANLLNLHDDQDQAGIDSVGMPGNDNGALMATTSLLSRVPLIKIDSTARKLGRADTFELFAALFVI